MTAEGPSSTRVRRLLIMVAVLGIGLAAAPVAFQMFDRAPKGGAMLDDFRPHMSQGQVDSFRAHLESIGGAEEEVGSRLDAVAGPGPWPAADALSTEWPGIRADMTEMLDDIEANLGRFEAVDALPPFPLFPWFFVIPGVLAAGLAGWGLIRIRGRQPVAPVLGAVAVLGIGLVAAPVVFQMFSRAPQGADMIDDLRPLMTEERVTTLQQSFLVIGVAEGELRVHAAPAAGELGHSFGDEMPATAAFIDRWPGMSAEMAPMIGAMADNIAGFAAVDALPPFDLFPWFFVVPGVALVGLGAAAGIRPGGRPTVVVAKASTPAVERELT